MHRSPASPDGGRFTGFAFECVTISQEGKDSPMAVAEIRKQISIFVPLSDWKALRAEAARRRVPMTELCRRWIGPELRRLQRPTSQDDADDRDEG